MAEDDVRGGEPVDAGTCPDPRHASERLDRRGFLRRAAKSVLPCIAALGIASALQGCGGGGGGSSKNTPGGSTSGCGTSCTSSCAQHCSSGCSSACASGCSSLCSSGCGGLCASSCQGACHVTCLYGV